MARADDWDEVPDEELEETLLERLEGLGEAVPDSLKTLFSSSIHAVRWTISNGLSFGRSALWIAATTSMIMFLPYIIEKERSDVEKTQVAQQRQMLLGPSAAAQAAALKQGLAARP